MSKRLQNAFLAVVASVLLAPAPAAGHDAPYPRAAIVTPASAGGSVEVIPTKVYEKTKVPVATQAERVRHVVQSAFDGHRIIIFSGGATKENDQSLLDEVKAIREGGGFGSIIGRNSFKRQKGEALKLLSQIMKIYSE